MRRWILAAAVLGASGGYLAMALSLPAGTAARPGPGFFPILVGAFAVLVALALAAASGRAAAAPGPSAPAEPKGRRRAAATAGLLVGFCLVLPWAGFPAAAFGFVALLLRRLGTTWPAALATALLTAGTAYYLFAVLLQVPLPRGAWFD